MEDGSSSAPYVVFFLWAVFMWVIPMFVGYRIGQNKGRATLGLVLSIFLGWLGVIITALVSRTVEAQAQRDMMIAQERTRLETQK